MLAVSVKWPPVIVANIFMEAENPINVHMANSL
jgi:hypothetical protein